MGADSVDRYNLSCGNYYLLVDSTGPNNQSYFENPNYYVDAWMNLHNQTIVEILQYFAMYAYVPGGFYNTAYICSQTPNPDYTVDFEHTIEIPDGHVLACVSLALAQATLTSIRRSIGQSTSGMVMGEPLIPRFGVNGGKAATTASKTQMA